MSFDSLKRYRPAVFLAGDDIDIPLAVRLVRGLLVFALAWTAAVLTFPLLHSVFIGDPAAEASALQRFSDRVAKVHREREAEGHALPNLSLRAETADTGPWSYRRLAVIEASGDEVAAYPLLEVLRPRLAWWLPTVRPVDQPVSIHPVLGAIAGLAVEPPGGGGDGVDEEVAAAWAGSLQTIYEKEMADLGWRPSWQRRLDGGIQFGTLWLFFAVLLVLAARFVCHVLPDRRLRRVRTFGDEAATPTPWARADGRPQELLELYRGAAQRADQATRCLGCRIQSPFLELRRYAVAAFLVAENISQIPAFLETKANSLVDRHHASLALTRYLIWAIPTLGFVGTVVGIGESLELTRELQGLEAIRVAIAKSAVSTSIGVAFDTTFVALVLSLPAMLVYHLVQGLEELNVLSRKDEAIDDLTYLENTRPFRCQAGRVAESLERLGLTAEVLERRLDQLPAAAQLAAPPTARPRTAAPLLWLMLMVTAGAAVAVWLGHLPSPWG